MQTRRDGPLRVGRQRGRLRSAAWAEMGSWPGPAAAAPLLTAMLQLLLNPQVAKRREERKGGRWRGEGAVAKGGEMVAEVWGRVDGHEEGLGT